MGLVDILNKIPLKAASKLVEKTGMSKYSYAQACNFLGVLPGVWCAAEGYNNGNTLAAIAGGLLASFNVLYSFYNPERKACESSGYIEKKVEELHKRNTIIDKKDLRVAVENQVAQANLSEQNLKPSALYQTLSGINFGIIGLLVSVSVEDSLNFDANRFAVYAGTIGFSSFLMGISHYFRAAK
ncbi:MAG: hypothetical protein V1914_01540 [archaeon]